MSDDRHARPKVRALIQLLRTAEDLWNASRVFFARWDLSPSQFNVLNLLYGVPDGMSQSDLSRLLIMHRSNATGLVDRLERRRLVRREPHPTDRRAYRVVITPSGADLLNEVYPHYFSAAERVWADLPDESVHQLLDRLQGLTSHATEIAGSEAAAVEARPVEQRPTALPVPRRNGTVRARSSKPSPRESVSTTPATRPPEHPLRTSDL